MCDGNSIKEIRYTLQITGADLKRKLQNVFELPVTGDSNMKN